MIELDPTSLTFGFMLGAITMVAVYGAYFFIRVHNNDDDDMV